MMEQYTMDDFDDYWTLLPVKDSEVCFVSEKFMYKFNAIFSFYLLTVFIQNITICVRKNHFPNQILFRQEISNYLKNPGGETSATRVLKKSTIAYLTQNLYNFPYPVCQLLKCFPPPICGQIVYDTLFRFSRDPETVLERKWKLFNYLANVHLSDKWMDKFEANVLPAIYKIVSENDEFDELPLALLSNRSPRMLRAYLDFEERQLCSNMNMYVPKAILLMAVHKKTHFLEPLILGQGREGVPPAAQDCATILRTVLAVNNGFSKCKENFQIIYGNFKGQIESELRENQQIFYNELERIFKLYEFMAANSSLYLRPNYGAPVSSFATKYSVIDFLYKHADGGHFLARLDFDAVRVLLVENHRLNQLINTKLPVSNASEISLFDQFYAIKLMAENLLLNHSLKNYEELISRNSQQIQEIIDRIEDPSAYIEAVEGLFTMLFYRWEHTIGLTGSKLLDVSSSITTMQETDTGDDFTDDSVFFPPRKLQQIHVNSEKKGFICTICVLESTLNFLTASTTLRKTCTQFQDSLDETTKIRFDLICNEVADAQWRLSLFELNQPSDGYQLSADLKTHLTSSFSDMNPKSMSSDEEDFHPRSPSISSARRKPRKKIPFRRRSDPERALSFTHSTENEKKSGESANRHVGTLDKRSIISKILGPSINLVAVCMTKGNMEEAKKIILVS